MSRIPGLMWNCLRGKLPQTRHLSENYEDLLFSLIESELKLGDYGHVPQDGDTFKPEGNIAEFTTGFGLDPIEDDIGGKYRPTLGAVKKTVGLDNFSVLVGWVDKRDEPKYLKEPVTAEAAVEFFVDLFAGSHLCNFIGNTVFFSELPRIMELENYTEFDTGTKKGRYPTEDVPGGREVNVTRQARRTNALVASLTQMNGGTFDLQLSPKFDVQVGCKRIGWMTLWIKQMGYRSTPFAEKVANLIATAYGPCQCQDTKFDRLNFLSEVDQIKKWREMLIATNDEHERWSLVNDIVGKVTLLTIVIRSCPAEVGID
ncbi:hypothetical protein EDC04DRAFT_2895978 [Pisolithus marmoratus]|nr:hypothetical protein EDC04DRAFT_2895978 [Pisolithus marmoratus]